MYAFKNSPIEWKAVGEKKSVPKRNRYGKKCQLMSVQVIFVVDTLVSYCCICYNITWTDVKIKKLWLRERP